MYNTLSPCSELIWGGKHLFGYVKQIILHVEVGYTLTCGRFTLEVNDNSLEMCWLYFAWQNNYRNLQPTCNMLQHQGSRPYLLLNAFCQIPHELVHFVMMTSICICFIASCGYIAQLRPLLASRRMYTTSFI